MEGLVNGTVGDDSTNLRRQFEKTMSEKEARVMVFHEIRKIDMTIINAHNSDKKYEKDIQN
jgi:hypothetical protein